MENPESVRLKEIIRYDNAGIEKLFEQYYVPLVLFAGAYVRDEEAAKDIVQDVFYVLVEKREHFDSIENLKVYLYSAVKNKCLKYIRHEGVKGRYEQYMLMNEQQEEKFYQEQILEEEVFALLYRAVRELPEQCQKVFLLALEGKSNAEIAGILGVGIETVKSHKKAGKKFLYDRLKNAMSCVLLAFILGQIEF